LPSSELRNHFFRGLFNLSPFESIGDLCDYSHTPNIVLFIARPRLFVLENNCNIR